MKSSLLLTTLLATALLGGCAQQPKSLYYWDGYQQQVYQRFENTTSTEEQIAYAKVNLNIVDVATSEVVYSSQGAGEYALSNREIIGFGGTASYDSTLNGKVLDLAIREAVNTLVNGMDSGAWRPVK